MNNIIKLKPAFKDYLWGGTKLREIYKKECDYEKVAESWELSNHPDGQSIVATGEYQGQLFSQYIEGIGKQALGSNCQEFHDFPVLIKFIDAKDSLSIQVHPSDEYAQKEEGQYGKTEMWYILDCEEDASLYYGVNKQVTKEEFEKRIKDNTILEVLNKVPVHKGDVFFIESGTIHAIGAGIIICEIQQNSNCTYRVYDFDRRDDKGNARELHVEKAMAVSNFTPSTDKIGAFGPINTLDGYTTQLLGKCKYFTTTKYEIETQAVIELDETSFRSLTILEGEGTVTFEDQVLEFSKGDSLFIPAQNGFVTVTGDCQCILTQI